MDGSDEAYYTLYLYLLRAPRPTEGVPRRPGPTGPTDGDVTRAEPAGPGKARRALQGPQERAEKALKN